jgi:pimeloyl-ACP methyl ester carboxylesterase
MAAARGPHGERTLEKSEWKMFISIFVKEHGIDNFAVVGFSMGGKFALATLEAFPQMTKKVFLIAPDGIKTSFWYNMATYPAVLRKFFRGMISNYHRFEKIATLLNKFRLADAGLIRFADYQMGTEEKRKRVYYSWVVFRHITFNIRKVAHFLNSYDIRTVVIAGKYDKIIEPENMKHFISLVRNAKLEVLESGHSGLIYQSLRFLNR